MASTPSNVVIVGGGLAGAKTAEGLRAKGYDGPITLLTAEQLLPYERPPLSKDYLNGKSSFDDAVVHPVAWYADNEVELRWGAEVTAVDPTGAEVELADESRVGYGALVLATGSAPRVCVVVPRLAANEIEQVVVDDLVARSALRAASEA